MTGGPWDGIIFTPDNEPYLGRELLRALDNLIVACLESNSKIARRTHQIAQRTDLQDAACVLIPQGVNLSLAIRELVRQGYLFAAKVLLRPLAERSVTILYLCENPAKMETWNRGWSHRERPTLARMNGLDQHDIARRRIWAGDGPQNDERLEQSDPRRSSERILEHDRNQRGDGWLWRFQEPREPEPLRRNLRRDYPVASTPARYDAPRFPRCRTGSSPTACELRSPRKEKRHRLSDRVSCQTDQVGVDHLRAIRTPSGAKARIPTGFWRHG